MITMLLLHIYLCGGNFQLVDDEYPDSDQDQSIDDPPPQ